MGDWAEKYIWQGSMDWQKTVIWTNKTPQNGGKYKTDENVSSFFYFIKVITIRKTTFQHSSEGNRIEIYIASSKRNKSLQMLRNLCDDLYER